MQRTLTEGGFTNGYVKHEEKINGERISTSDGLKGDPEEKAVLPVEMASMIPLRAVIGKLIHKAHADLMTLTDT